METIAVLNRMNDPFDAPTVLGVSVTHKQTGGALLGKGVYGCTFKPVPFCAGGRVFRPLAAPSSSATTMVGKISDRSLAEEIAFGRDLMRLPLAANYFAVPTEGCTPRQPVADPDAGRCPLLRKAGLFTTLHMAAMPDAGTTLLKWSEDLERVVRHFEAICIHLLEGIILYQSAGIVHNDIHWGNILIDERAVPRIIDFGLAFRPAAVKEWDDSNLGTEFKPKYVWQAPEIHAARLVIGERPIAVAEAVSRLKAKSEEYAQLERAFPRRLSLEAAMAKFIRDNRGDKRRFTEYVRTEGQRLDWWRIGLCMWQLWMDMAKEVRDFRESDLYRNRRHVILRVIGGLTEFDPMARMSVTEALRLLKNKEPTSIV